VNNFKLIPNRYNLKRWRREAKSRCTNDAHEEKIQDGANLDNTGIFMAYNHWIGVPTKPLGSSMYIE